MLLEIILIAALIMGSLYFGYLIGKKLTELRWEKIHLPRFRQEAVQQSRAVLTGQFSEQIAPYLPDFPFSPTEARFIGSPVDFIIFEGLDNKEVKKISFVEVKSSKSRLSNTEKSIMNAVKNRKVDWHEYRVPDNIIKKEK